MDKGSLLRPLLVGLDPASSPPGSHTMKLGHHGGPDRPSVDLTSCDREPIHVPGHIMPHGAMLVLDPATYEIEQAAGDCQRLLGLPAEMLAGSPLTGLFTRDQLQHFSELVARSTLDHPRHLLHPLLSRPDGRPVDASVHRSHDTLVLEFEDADLADRHVVDPLACVQEMLNGLKDCETLQALCQGAANNVRTVMGYDRVMVYRFASDGSGWVFAEARRDDLTAFLDLHYPASDIPAQARALYLTNSLRIVTEVDYEPAPLRPALNQRTQEALDMSHATLRDVSPIHREYLRNMGVAATMAISILVEGRLWGMLVAHHYVPRRLPRHLRAVSELFGTMFSLQLEARIRAEKLEARLQSRVNRRANGTPYRRAKGTPFHDGARLIGHAPLRCARRREGGARPEARAAQSIF